MYMYGQLIHRIRYTTVRVLLCMYMGPLTSLWPTCSLNLRGRGSDMPTQCPALTTLMHNNNYMTLYSQINDEYLGPSLPPTL